MRSTLAIALLLTSLTAFAKPVHAATPVDALFTTLEAATPDCSVVALYDNGRIVLLQSTAMAVEVKAHATTKRPVNSGKESATAACFVALLARNATAHGAAA